MRRLETVLSEERWRAPHSHLAQYQAAYQGELRPDLASYNGLGRAGRGKTKYGQDGRQEGLEQSLLIITDLTTPVNAAQIHIEVNIM